MATFEDVVKQLQMNNRSEAGRDSRHTKMLSDLKNSIEGLTVATEQSSEPESSKEEKNKEERSRASKLLDAVGGLKDSLKTGLSDVMFGRKNSTWFLVKHNVGVIWSKYGNFGNSKSANSAAFTNPARCFWSRIITIEPRRNAAREASIFVEIF